MLRSLAHGLEQVALGRRVLKLDSLDAAKIVQVAGPFVVGRRCRELALADQLVSLVIQSVVEIVTQEAVQDDGLAFVVALQRACTQATVEEPRKKPFLKSTQTNRDKWTTTNMPSVRLTLDCLKRSNFKDP